jgi:2-keto-4-pentenoate hydratase
MTIADPRVTAGMAAQLALRGQLLGAGAKHLGWKCGFASAPARKQLGTSAPLFGFLTDRGLLPSGSSIAIEGWIGAVLEPEIAVHLGRDLPPGAGPDEIRESIAALGPAIEVADFDPSVTEVEAILSGDIFHRHVLLGPPDASHAGFQTAEVSAVVSSDGLEIARSSYPAALTGELVDTLGQLAAALRDCGERLRAGDIVIAGSLVRPIAVAAGSLYRAEIEPLGALEVRFQEGAR